MYGSSDQIISVITEYKSTNSSSVQIWLEYMKSLDEYGSNI